MPCNKYVISFQSKLNKSFTILMIIWIKTRKTLKLYRMFTYIFAMFNPNVELIDGG